MRGGRVAGSAVPHRRKSSAQGASPRRGLALSGPKSRLVKRMARGALLAVGFTALQYFGEDLAADRRLFDARVVDRLQAPLTHYHE